MTENQNYLDQYIDTVSHLPSLTGAQVNDLVVKFQSGETHHSDRLLAQYAKMIRGIISNYTKRHENNLNGGDSIIDDLFNQSVLTFMECLGRFEVSRGLHLSTYVYTSISFSIKTYCKKQRNIVNPWVNVKWTRVANQIYKWVPKNVSIDQVQMSLNDANELSKVADAPADYIIDVFSELKNGESDSHLDDVSHMLPGSDTDLEKDVDRLVKLDKINKCVDKIVDARSRFIVKQYFLSNKAVSIQSIADELGMSPRNVRNHINKVINNLKMEFSVEEAA